MLDNFFSSAVWCCWKSTKLSSIYSTNSSYKSMFCLLSCWKFAEFDCSFESLHISNYCRMESRIRSDSNGIRTMSNCFVLIVYYTQQYGRNTSQMFYQIKYMSYIYNDFGQTLIMIIFPVIIMLVFGFCTIRNIHQRVGK